MQRRVRVLSGAASSAFKEDCYGFSDRKGDRRTVAVGVSAACDADPDADRLERRVHAAAAEREAEGGRGAPARHGRRARRRAGLEPPAVLPDRRRHGGGLRGAQRDLRHGVRREPRGSRDARDGAGARRRAQRPVHHGHAHALPARRHAAGEFRALARGGRQGGLESGIGRQAADARRPEVQQLLQGNLSRQRHQDRADLVVAVGNPARLVPHQRDDDRGARQGEQGGGRAAHVRACDLHARLGRLARAARRLAAAQAGIDQGLHGRRQHQQGRSQASVAAWTTRRSPTRPTSCA